MPPRTSTTRPEPRRRDDRAAIRLLPPDHTGADASHVHPVPTNPSRRTTNQLGPDNPKQDAPNGDAVKALRPLRGRAPPEPGPRRLIGAPTHRVGDKKKSRPTLLTGPAPSGMTCGNAVRAGVKGLVAGNSRGNVGAARSCLRPSLLLTSSLAWGGGYAIATEGQSDSARRTGSCGREPHDAGRCQRGDGGCWTSAYGADPRI